MMGVTRIVIDKSRHALFLFHHADTIKRELFIILRSEGEMHNDLSKMWR